MKQVRGKFKIKYAGEFAGTASAAAPIETKPAAKAGAIGGIE
jgi:hypothetical protein